VLALATVLSLAVSAGASAAPGDLDPTFGKDGKAHFDFPPAEGMVRQDDGKFVVVGPLLGSAPHGWVVGRVTPGGRIDRTFGDDGSTRTKFTTGPNEAGPGGIALQGRRIVIGGVAGKPSGGSDFVAARYLRNGRLDETFGNGGITRIGFEGLFGSAHVSAGGNAVVVQPDRKIVLVGQVRNQLSPGERTAALVRLNPDGDLDESFGNEGRVVTDLSADIRSLHDAALDSSGRIVAVGLSSASDENRLVRYTTEGELDPTFDEDGVRTPVGRPLYAPAVAIQPDGKILVAALAPDGRGGRAFSLERFNEDGSPDESFGSGGQAVTDFTPGDDVARDVALQASGKIVVVGVAAGKRGRFAVVRYNSDGTVDSTFGGGDGKVAANLSRRRDSAASVVIQPNTRIVAAGEADGYSWDDGHLGMARFGGG
jgi:uncharacterized delta-60 repeat protein